MPQPKKPNLKPDPVVDALMADPTQGPPGTTVLSGYLGASPTEGVWRLYLDAGLTEYVEIPEADIMHSETLPDASGTTVWVSSSAALTHVRTQTQDVQAEFLGGAITDELLASPAAAAARPIGPAPQISIAGPCVSRIQCPSTINCPSVQVICPSSVDACPSRLRPCISRIPCPTTIQCPSRVTICQSRLTCQPSVFTPCLSQQIRCPSAVDACPTRFGCPSVDTLCQTIGIGCIPSRLVACPTDPASCPQPSAAFVCPTFGPCPSIAGCPSDGFCGDPGGGGFDPGQQFGGGGIG
jgi:hypothetical protein